jgi:hypothetical protein
VLVDYGPTVRNARIVHASVHGLVRRLEDAHAGEDALVIGIPSTS